MLQRRLLLSTLAAAALAAGCATPQTPPSPVPVTDALARDPQFSTLSGLVQKAGLGDTLRGAGPFTVFAPTNEAFKGVSARQMDELGRDPALLGSVLRFHVVPGKLGAAGIQNSTVKSVQGASLSLSRAGEFVTVEEAMVLAPDLAASNGVVHGIDRVLMPPRK